MPPDMDVTTDPEAHMTPNPELTLVTTQRDEAWRREASLSGKLVSHPDVIKCLLAIEDEEPGLLKIQREMIARHEARTQEKT